MINLPLIIFIMFIWYSICKTLSYVRFIVKFIKTSLHAATSSKQNNLISFSNHEYSDSNIELKIPGQIGLPFIGETISYLLNTKKFLLNKRAKYGNIFSINIDFSGSFLASRKVICIFPNESICINPILLDQAHKDKSKTTLPHSLHTHHTTCTTTPSTTYNDSHIMSLYNNKLQVLGYTGYYGNSAYHTYYRTVLVPQLVNRVLNDYNYIDQWEDIATPIIQSFLYRLTFERATVDFVDHIDE